MDFRAIGVALLLACLPLAGCGTTTNLVCAPPEAGGKTPFGGVRQDVSQMKKAANGEFCLKKQPMAESVQHPQVLPMLFYAADLPLTLIGDTVTWPYAVSYSFINAPVPTPPITPALVQPVPQTATEFRPQPSPLPTLPEPRTLP